MAFLNLWSVRSDVTTNTYFRADFYLLEQSAAGNTSCLGFAIYLCSATRNPTAANAYVTGSFVANDPADAQAFDRINFKVGSILNMDLGRSTSTAYVTTVNGRSEAHKILKTNMKTFYSGNSEYIAYDHSLYAYDYGLWIDHNENGTKKLNFTYEIQANCEIDGIYFDTININGELDLQDIGSNVVIRNVSPVTLTDEVDPIIQLFSLTPNAVTNLELEMAYYESADSVTQIAHRILPAATTGNYTLTLTDEERNLMRTLAANVTEFQVRFTVYTTLINDATVHAYHHMENFAVVNSKPSVHNLMVREANDDVFALTGDRNVLVKYKSAAEFSFEPIASKGATIASTTAQNGKVVFENMYQGLFQDVQNSLFVFTVIDSRGLKTMTYKEPQMIPYLNPTCYVECELELSGETSVDAHLRVFGSFYNGSFGAVDNELTLQVRHTSNDGGMTDWADITALGIETNGNTYELEFNITDLTYKANYDFQCRVIDKANVSYTESSRISKILSPVYDWGMTDFNFNVPVKMNEQTVLRHNKTENRTILSASGGSIYLRPNGTDNEDGQVIIHPSGLIETTGGGDFIIETGKEPMGTNGTWYWEKWASGKAVCWGTRNFGTASLGADDGTTVIFTSGTYTQNFPSGLFINAPIAMTSFDKRSDVTYPNPTWTTTRNISKSSMTFWLCSFVSGRISASDTSFYVIGRWKEETA